jgi:predicted PurR-regulated permease PerM
MDHNFAAGQVSGRVHPNLPRANMAKRRRKRNSDETAKADSSGSPTDASSAAQSSPETSSVKAPPEKASQERALQGTGSSQRSAESPNRAIDSGALDDFAKHPLFPRLPSLSRIMSVVMLMIGILVIGALFYQVMAGFFVPLFLATLLVVIFRPVHQWILTKVGMRPRLAALGTTLLIMLVVLLPVIAVLSVATSQFTAMVSHADFNDLTEALERVRQQLSISLKRPDQFRRLDKLADSFDTPDQPENVLASIEEARLLVRFLQKNAAEPATEAAAAEAADKAEVRLDEFAAAVRAHMAEDLSQDAIEEFDAEEKFHRQSVIAAAAIRAWMRTLLGGTLRSQAKLLANPSEADFAALLRKGREALQPRFIQVTSATGAFLLQMGLGLLILVISVYFFLLDGPLIIRTLMRLSPMDDNYERRLLLEFDRTSRAVVLASVASALVQGILAATAYWLLGFDSVILLFLLTTIMALVPFLGAASVWVPCAVWLAAVDQRWTAAIGLAIYGAAVVSSIDNVIKVYVLHGRSTLHPLFALLSVFGGVQVFGPIGILIGPMVVVFLQTLLEILNHELVSTETDVAHEAKKQSRSLEIE